jgi:redox-sensitive bicupin YhaK (pirin superfamily)
VRTIFAAHSNDAELISPFLLLDYAEPHNFPPSTTSRPRGVEQHPHRGFETVTIVFQGALEHRDSAGHSGRIGPGDVQWMTAASGVVHEEMHARDFTRDGGTFEVAQLWVNLPAREKMSKPRYQELLSDAIPQMTLGGGAATARIIAGTLLGTTGPARTVTPINLWDVRIKAGATIELTLPDGNNSLLFLMRGRTTINEPQPISAVECAVLDREGESVTIHADEEAALLVLTGDPIDEPVVAHGPFVMNTVTEIKEAFQDYQSGRMGRLLPATN